MPAKPPRKRAAQLLAAVALCCPLTLGAPLAASAEPDTGRPELPSHVPTDSANQARQTSEETRTLSGKVIFPEDVEPWVPGLLGIELKQSPWVEGGVHIDLETSDQVEYDDMTGAFTISDVPPGTYTLRLHDENSYNMYGGLWLPEGQELEVDVTENNVDSLRFELSRRGFLSVGGSICGGDWAEGGLGWNQVHGFATDLESGEEFALEWNSYRVESDEECPVAYSFFAEVEPGTYKIRASLNGVDRWANTEIYQGVSDAASASAIPVATLRHSIQETDLNLDFPDLFDQLLEQNRGGIEIVSETVSPAASFSVYLGADRTGKEVLGRAYYGSHGDWRSLGTAVVDEKGLAQFESSPAEPDDYRLAVVTAGGGLIGWDDLSIATQPDQKSDADSTSTPEPNPTPQPQPESSEDPEIHSGTAGGSAADRSDTHLARTGAHLEQNLVLGGILAAAGSAFLLGSRRRA